MARADDFLAKIAGGEAYIRQRLADDPNVSFNSVERGLKEAGLSFGTRQEKQAVFRAIAGRANTGGATGEEAAKKGGRRSSLTRRVNSQYNRLIKSAAFRGLPARVQAQFEGSGETESLKSILRRLNEAQDDGSAPARGVRYNYRPETHTFTAYIEGEEPDYDDYLELEEGEEIRDTGAVADHFHNADIAAVHDFMQHVFDAVGM